MVDKVKVLLTKHVEEVDLRRLAPKLRESSAHDVTALDNPMVMRALDWGDCKVVD